MATLEELFQERERILRKRRAAAAAADEVMDDKLYDAMWQVNDAIMRAPVRGVGDLAVKARLVNSILRRAARGDGVQDELISRFCRDVAALARR